MKYAVLAMLFLFGLLPVSQPNAREPLVITTGFSKPVSIIYQRLLEEACTRIGVELVFSELSAERSVILANQGVNDGECCRIPAMLEQQYPDLLPVPEQVLVVEFSAFSKDPSIQLKAWDDLEPYAVGTVVGWKIVVNNIETVKPSSYVMLDAVDPLMMMLSMGRIDVAVIGRLSGQYSLKQQGIEGVHVLEPPLATMPVHLMLHKKHAALVPEFDAAFKAMKADGSMAGIISDVMQ